jgi:hypothetical protein
VQRAVWRRKVRVERWLEVDGEGSADRSAVFENVSALTSDRGAEASSGDEPPPLWTPAVGFTRDAYWFNGLFTVAYLTNLSVK